MAPTNGKGTYAGTWPGGRLWRRADGRSVYVIRKMIDGERFTVSTHATSLAAAMKQLERFQADPRGYNPAGDPRAEPIYLNDALVSEYLTWSKKVGGKRGRGGNSPGWLRKKKHILADWTEKLAGIDLRRASLTDHILPPLNGATSRTHRVAVIKSLYSYLRQETHAIKATEDPTLGTLSVPQANPEQFTRSKVVPREHVLLVIEHLTSPWRDALLLQAATGWHVSEVTRFATKGTIEPVPAHERQSAVAGIVVSPLHKSGAPIRTRVGPEALEAAKRLRSHGVFSERDYYRAVKAACCAVMRPDGGVGVPPFSPGMMRHSVATWAVEDGADLASVSTFLGHKSAWTTKRFYATFATPAKVPTLV